MDINPISLSLAWWPSSAQYEESLIWYKLHFSNCLKKDQHNDVVRPFYHFRPSCDVIIMETWHILRCALSTQDWTKCYTGICLKFKCIMPDKYYIVLEGENSCHRKMESQAASHDKASHYEFAAWKVSSRMFLDFAFSIRFQVANPRVGVLFERRCQFTKINTRYAVS